VCLSNELLLAITLFHLMGAILERCGLCEDILDSMGQLFGPSAAASAIQSSSSVSSRAITGTGGGRRSCHGADLDAVMMRYGYNIAYITGVLAASGLSHNWCPVACAHRAGRSARKSVGDMYLGAWGPSVFQVHFSPVTNFFSASSNRPCAAGAEDRVDADRMATVA